MPANLTRAEIATLGLRVDASGVLVATTALKGLETQGGKTESSVARLGTASRTSSAGVNALRGSLTPLAVSLAGADPMVGRLVSTLGMFAVGSGVMIGVLGGIAAVSGAYRLLTKDARENREAVESSRKELEKWLEARRIAGLGAGGVQQTQLLSLYGQESDLRKRLSTVPGEGDGGSFINRAKLEKELAEVVALERKAEAAISEVMREAESERIKGLIETQDRQIAEHQRRADASARIAKSESDALIGEMQRAMHTIQKEIDQAAATRVARVQLTAPTNTTGPMRGYISPFEGGRLSGQNDFGLSASDMEGVARLAENARKAEVAATDLSAALQGMQAAANGSAQGVALAASSMLHLSTSTATFLGATGLVIDLIVAGFKRAQQQAAERDALIAANEARLNAQDAAAMAFYIRRMAEATAEREAKEAARVAAILATEAEKELTAQRMRAAEEAQTRAYEEGLRAEEAQRAKEAADAVRELNEATAQLAKESADAAMAIAAATAELARQRDILAGWGDLNVRSLAAGGWSDEADALRLQLRHQKEAQDAAGMDAAFKAELARVQAAELAALRAAQAARNAPGAVTASPYIGNTSAQDAYTASTFKDVSIWKGLQTMSDSTGVDIAGIQRSALAVLQAQLTIQEAIERNTRSSGGGFGFNERISGSPELQ